MNKQIEEDNVWLVFIMYIVDLVNVLFQELRVEVYCEEFRRLNRDRLDIQIYLKYMIYYCLVGK